MAAVCQKLSDEDWLVSRARSCMKTDPFAAKAWMITARTLFPQNFSIQFEAYNLEKVGKNIKEAAKLLEEMFVAFPGESRLWAEVQAILGVLQSETSDNRNSFLTEIFAAISTHSQCEMLLHVADKMSDTLEQCRLLLLAMRKFASLVDEHGLTLIEKLQRAEKKAGYATAVNCYRKLFICDVLPLVLQKVKKMDVPQRQLYKWLQQAIEFYVMFITQAPCLPSSQPPSPDQVSPTKKGKRFVLIPGLYDRESQVIDPWGSLLKLLVLIGQHLDWEIDSDLFTQTRDQQWQYVFNVYNRAKQIQGSPYTKQIVYVTTVLFLECLYTYVSSVDPDAFVGGATVHGPLVLIEGFSNDLLDNPSPSKAKKSKTSGSATHIVATSGVPDSQKIIESFLTAFKCYELLHSKQELQREFVGLCEVWRMETWTWMAHFQTDMLMYQGAFQDALAHLQSCTPLVKDSMKIRSSLQMACCFMALGKYSKACEILLEVISYLPGGQRSDKNALPNDPLSGRHLLLTLCTEEEIIPYCVQLLLSCLKEKALSPNKTDDTALGHMVVLLQYDWPRQEPLFQQVAKKIRSQGSFTYNLFFNFIINIDILEEFAFLKTQEGGKVSLDILPISTKSIAQQRTVTRGVNKNVKEDFKHTMEKQVARSEENIDALIRNFLLEERQQIIKSV
ncbi:integrator complex subunit 10-like [Ylistrum balloti]|uniref:integrator complex subunit 10-like n=1 Tax=Ylistrum balloti TaxID=509963 RepID=UPI002905B0EA|nr:integrator complex subunit 10-like [Ylistrum balloti]